MLCSDRSISGSRPRALSALRIEPRRAMPGATAPGLLVGRDRRMWSSDEGDHAQDRKHGPEHDERTEGSHLYLRR